MARPVQTEAEGTRGRILEAARAAFSAEGIDGTSMRAVAAAAGVNIATVHHHFGSKDGLAEACIDAAYDELAELKEMLVARWCPGQPLSTLVEDAVRAAWRFACAHRAAHRMLLRIVVDAERAGAVGRARRDRNSAETLVEAARLLASMTGRSEREARLLVQTLSNLLVRWSLAPKDELVGVVSGDPRGSGPISEQSLEALERSVEDHLVDVTCRLLGLERPTECVRRTP